MLESEPRGYKTPKLSNLGRVKARNTTLCMKLKSNLMPFMN